MSASAKCHRTDDDSFVAIADTSFTIWFVSFWSFVAVAIYTCILVVAAAVYACTCILFGPLLVLTISITTP